MKGTGRFGNMTLVMLTFNAGWYVSISEITTHVGPVVCVTKGNIGLVEPEVTEGVMG